MFRTLLARLLPRKEIKKAEKEMDEYMREGGGRKLNPLYKPRRRVIKSDMEPGDIKTVGRITKVE